jgi:hypothetical protein
MSPARHPPPQRPPRLAMVDNPTHLTYGPFFIDRGLRFESGRGLKTCNPLLLLSGQTRYL